VDTRTPEDDASEGSPAPAGDSGDEEALRDAPSDAAPPRQCWKDTDCPITKLHCDLGSGQCVQCTVDAHCVVFPSYKCDKAIFRCMECLVDADCGTNKACEPETHRCVVTCGGGKGCPTGDACDGRGVCLACTNNDACFRDQMCDLRVGMCAACVDDRSCPADRPHCDPYRVDSGRCLMCLTPRDCPADHPFCDLHSGNCLDSDGNPMPDGGL
jgi:hypothetical protein